MAQTLFDKIWERHVIVRRGERDALLHIDRNYLHEGAFHAFEALKASGRPLRKPSQTFGFADHYVPTVGREKGLAGIADDEARNLVALFDVHGKEFGFTHYGMNHERQGIVHVTGPELGLTQPGLTITCGDSHTATHGAFGAYALGIGAPQLTQIFATQALWLTRPKSMRVTVDGNLGPSVTAKDVILAIIAKIGAGGAVGHVLEYAGSAIRGLSMEGRMTLCNMSIEAGGRAGMVAPDDTTYQYVNGRPFAPKGADWDQALGLWRKLPSDADASYHAEVRLDASSLAPMVTWGTSPEDALPVTGVVPDPSSASDPAKRTQLEQALRYMDLKPGQPISSIKVDRVFIGSCTNSRIEDLRAAAAVLKGRKAVVPSMVSPGSRAIKREAEAEGLDRIFTEAGVEWRDSGCSMCVGMNGDLLRAGERSASTSNRNFEGRQGKGARTHLVSPLTAAAAAITGRLADVRTLA